MSHCCEQMNDEVNEISNPRKSKNHSIIYDRVWRKYMIKCVYYDRGGNNMCSLILYCPWCGSKLPSSLADAWFDTLSSEYNIQDPSDTDRKKVPLEFKTDEWWKKRGL